jgi:hypothetical protein
MKEMRRKRFGRCKEWILRDSKLLLSGRKENQLLGGEEMI